MYAIVIDKQGYKVDFVVLNEDKSPQYYTLKDGESIIENDWNIANSMNKPQWVNGEWIDTEPLPPVEPPIVEEDKITIFLTKLNSYKHDYIRFITYDGGSQRTLPEDRVMILDCQESLERGIRTEVMWKYPEKYVTVTNPQYFIDMRMAIGNAIEKAFQVEYILTQEINALTDEQAKIYDMEKRFDDVFKTLP